ncbi:MAG TPA: GNAT family N-acetyltransferase [Bryobacteraceae bacterium]|nr:GNAT family N-acetyltransferase [Bryobacteraceae bacterium]
MESLAIVEADPAEPEAGGLIADLDAELAARYPGLPIHGIEAAGFRRGGGVFLLGRLAGVAVACGAIRPLGAGIAELKRMYVARDHRGRGFARALQKRRLPANRLLRQVPRGPALAVL